LVLIPSDQHYIRLEYGASNRKGEQGASFSFRAWGDQLGIAGETDFMPGDWRPNEDHLYLRLERQGDCIRASISPDDKRWNPTLSFMSQALPEKFKAGLAAYSTSTEPSKVRFDQFRLTRGRKESK
jgi:regulation of enolase protein 1 (concanavalin A-like superfamily)